MTQENRTILYIDDDADDREFLADAIRKFSPGVGLVEAENGLQALEYLHTMKIEKRSLPSLIVLDLNLPYADGKEVFRLIKEDAVLKEVPLVVFSSSGNPNDK